MSELSYEEGKLFEQILENQREMMNLMKIIGDMVHQFSTSGKPKKRKSRKEEMNDLEATYGQEEEDEIDNIGNE